MVIRKMDKIGRLVIPIKFCRQLKTSEVEIIIENGVICIKPFTRGEIHNKPYIGIVRKLDPLNRVVIPKEYMKVLDIKENEDYILILSGEKILAYPKYLIAF